MEVDDKEWLQEKLSRALEAVKREKNIRKESEREIQGLKDSLEKKLQDISRLSRAHALLKRRLEAIIKVSRTLNSSRNLGELLENIMVIVSDMLRVKASSLFLIDESRERLVAQAATGEKAEEIKNFSFKLDEGIIGLVAQKGKPIIVNDAPHDHRHLSGVDKVLSYKVYNILCVPLKIVDHTIGVLEVMNRVDGKPFTRNDVLISSAIANQAALLIENMRLSEKVGDLVL